ncbi:copper amine oxidase N-terminal domain-containing protein [Paenibacillus campinasensis]|nr:copper amine oxidase N-terminal domain-containing protein [Paenibacillus campinasensis]
MKITKSIAICMLFALLLSTAAHAAEVFFWSEAEPRPSCTNNTRDGSTGNIGLIIDGEKKELDLPTCTEAINNRVLVLVDGNYLHTVAGTGAEPFIENGRTMIPLRALADAFDFEVEWKQSEAKITLKKEDTVIIMHIGQPEMFVNGKAVKLENAVPMIKNNVTFLPVRQLAEILSINVKWDHKTRTAVFALK